MASTGLGPVLLLASSGPHVGCQHPEVMPVFGMVRVGSGLRLTFHHFQQGGTVEAVWQSGPVGVPQLTLVAGGRTFRRKGSALRGIRRISESAWTNQ